MLEIGDVVEVGSEVVLHGLDHCARGVVVDMFTSDPDYDMRTCQVLFQVLFLNGMQLWFNSGSLSRVK